MRAGTAIPGEFQEFHRRPGSAFPALNDLGLINRGQLTLSSPRRFQLQENPREEAEFPEKIHSGAAGDPKFPKVLNIPAPKSSPNSRGGQDPSLDTGNAIPTGKRERLQLLQEKKPSKTLEPPKKEGFWGLELIFSAFLIFFPILDPHGIPGNGWDGIRNVEWGSNHGNVRKAAGMFHPGRHFPTPQNSHFSRLSPPFWRLPGPLGISGISPGKLLASRDFFSRREFPRFATAGIIRG